MPTPDHGPVEQEYREMLNALASALDEFFNPDPNNKKVAFAVLMSPFGAADNGRVNYISNASRSDMMKMMDELLKRWKGFAGHQGRLSIDQMADILAATRGKEFKR